MSACQSPGGHNQAGSQSPEAGQGLGGPAGWRLSSFSEESGTMAKEASGGKEDEAVSTSAVSPF